MAADDRDWARGIEVQIPDVRKFEDLRIGERVKLELRPKRDPTTGDLLGCPYVQHLQWFAAIEPLGQLLRWNLWWLGVGHGLQVVSLPIPENATT
jgi:hypothetical protein